MATEIKAENHDSWGWRMYHAQDDPVALIRAQHRLELPWIAERIKRHIGYHAEVLDVGCGAGFLPNDLALKSYRVTGIDLSVESLKAAQEWDSTQSVRYQEGDVYQIPFPDKSFDVVTAMDLLEHVSDPQQVLSEVARVLRPGGIFFYNTLNHHLYAWLIGIKGIEWFVKNAPKDYHVFSLFRRPSTLQSWLLDAGMPSLEMCGVRPILFQSAIPHLIRTGLVDDSFRYKFSRSLSVGYLGYAKKMRY